MEGAVLLVSYFRRDKLSTTLPSRSIIAEFILFGYLAAIRKAFEMGA